jgi:hypothetical protein
LIPIGTIFRARDYVRGTATTPQAAPTGFRILEGEGDYYLLQNFLTVFAVRPDSYALVTIILQNCLGRDFHHLHPSNTEVKNECGYTSTLPPYPNGVDRVFFTLFDFYCTVGLVETAASVSCNLYFYPEVKFRNFPQKSYQTTQRHVSENGNILEQFKTRTASSSEMLANSYEIAYRHIPAGVIFNTLKQKLYQ